MSRVYGTAFLEQVARLRAVATAEGVVGRDVLTSCRALLLVTAVRASIRPAYVEITARVVRRVCEARIHVEDCHVGQATLNVHACP